MRCKAYPDQTAGDGYDPEFLITTVLHMERLVHQARPGGQNVHTIRVSDPKMHFSSAHFVEDAEGCERLHGHNYYVEIELSGQLDEHGMVADFRAVRRRIVEICEELDHRVLLPGKSESIQLKHKEDSIEIMVDQKNYVFPASDCVVLPIMTTTAELLAELILQRSGLSDEFEQAKVCVAESRFSFGCYET
ncbi:MAG: 6-pyruvoyl tetrahydropterin synthase family protein [Candidatus Thorarchaeota archaeon]|nr:6-pyruvoyl tetrahydropterin synthase family protein [Candidatus Thorarchaeota archaeon]